MSIMDRHSEERYEAAIEGMLATPRYIADFLMDGAEVDVVIGLLLTRGLPLRTRDHRDDHLIDTYDTEIERLHEEFARFAHGRESGAPMSRIDTYITRRNAEHMEDAA